LCELTHGSFVCTHADAQRRAAAAAAKLDGGAAFAEAYAGQLGMRFATDSGARLATRTHRTHRTHTSFAPHSSRAISVVRFVLHAFPDTSRAGPGEWGIVFTNIDHAAPDAQFRFALHVGDTYTRACVTALNM
jgi:hypothetical protein